MVSSLVNGLNERISQAASMHSSVGVILPSNNYDDFTQAVFAFIRDQQSKHWVYVTITKPFHTIKEQHQGNIKGLNIDFIDCVSHAAGISTQDERCFFLDSPSQLENLILEIMNFVKEKSHNDTSFVVLDSLSSLMLYNDELLVTEFFTHLMNNLHLVNAHSIALCIEEEMNDMMHKILYLRNDKILKIKESFI